MRANIIIILIIILITALVIGLMVAQSQVVALVVGPMVAQIVGIIVGLFILIVALIISYPDIRLLMQPKETVYVTVKRIKSAVEVLDERLSLPDYDDGIKVKVKEAHFVTFEFPNGLEKEFELSHQQIHKVTEVNVSGILTYKEIINATSYKDRMFLKFE